MLYSKLKAIGKWYAFFILMSGVIYLTIIEVASPHISSGRAQDITLILAFTSALLVTRNFIETSMASLPARSRRTSPLYRRKNTSPHCLNGKEFEYWVADQLQDQGWRVWVTRTNGDQGIDVIATRWLRKVGIQCKRYKGSVGNAAIQQAFAGKTYYNLDHAAVITTGYYTKSAKELAEKTGVMLLTVQDIPDLAKLCKMRKRK